MKTTNPLLQLVEQRKTEALCNCEDPKHAECAIGDCKIFGGPETYPEICDLVGTDEGENSEKEKK